MKVKPLGVFEALQGKVCQHSDMYVRMNKRTGKMYTGKLCNPSEAEPTADQIAARQLFKQRRAKAAEIAADPAQWAEYASAYEGQRKYSTKIGFLFHKIVMGDIAL